MKLQSAIFDMDGTQLDSMPIWRDLGTSVLRGLGIEPEPETDEMLKTCLLYTSMAGLRSGTCVWISSVRSTRSAPKTV